jgi:hypothetical protein
MSAGVGHHAEYMLNLVAALLSFLLPYAMARIHGRGFGMLEVSVRDLFRLYRCMLWPDGRDV